VQQKTLRDHQVFLRTLRQGDTVRLTMDSKTLAVKVIREWHSADADGYGPAEECRVTVGYGPGRWNTDVSAHNLMPREDHGSGYVLVKGDS
jgi:hypothetical protein